VIVAGDGGIAVARHRAMRREAGVVPADDAFDGLTVISS